MAGFSPINYVLAKNSAAQIAAGIDHYEVDGLNLNIYPLDGEMLTMTFPVPSIGIEDMYIDTNQHLIVVFDDGSIRDCGLVPGGGSIDTKVVDVLPTTNISPTTIYLLASTDAKGNDVYEEFLYINNKWERFGTRTSAVEEINESGAANSDIDNLF